MDFGGFVLFGLLAMGLWVGVLSLARAFFARSTWRWRGLGLWFGGLVLLVVLWHHLYQVYSLDEGLFIATVTGDIAQVKILLSAGLAQMRHGKMGPRPFPQHDAAVTKKS